MNLNSKPQTQPRSQLVKNSIIPGAKIAIVTDTPSAEDVVRGKLFRDRTAQILLGKLAAYGIDITQCSLLSVAQIRHTTAQYMNSQELLAWQALLERDLHKAKPNIIVAVGDVALKALADVRSSETYRGTPVEGSLYPCTVIPLEHHLMYYSSPAWQPLTDFYAQKIARYQHLTESPVPNITVHITDDIELLESVFLDPGYLADPGSFLAFDIETSNAEMTCIGFARKADEAYVIPCVHLPADRLVPAIRTIDRILRSPVAKIAQNGNYDITYLAYKYGIKVENFAWDTMLCWHSIYPNLPKDLGTISSVCTDQRMWKLDGKQWMLPYDQIDWPQFFRYNGYDAANLITIQEVEKDLLAARQTQATFDREMSLCYPFICMELDGIKINTHRLEEMQRTNEEEIRRWQLYLDTYLGEDAINVASPDQIKKLLFTTWKLPKRVRGGKLTTDEDALVSLIPLAPELIKPIMILKKLRKENSEYRAKLGPDGKMRATFKPAGTITGRAASSKSIFGTGGNLQNKTKKIRVYYEPDDQETQVILNIDYAKAESWIVAALAEDERMLAALYGEDFHSTNATNILGKPVSKANYSDRQLGKRITHGASYQMTAFLLQKVLLKDGYNFSKGETEDLMEMFHRTYPNIRKVFHRRVEEKLRKNRTLTNCYGRKITFWDHWSQQLLNSATAWEPQGTVGDMTNSGLVNVYRNVPEVRILIQVHDSVVMQVNKADLNDTLITRLSECMLQELTINGITFTVPIDIEVGPNWLELTDWNKAKALYTKNTLLGDQLT